ncbi:hypothetical protein Cfor_10907 [Coptotermes formosanus]|uniref:Uncharacterized protein n=1 Tax=Coptotermes formosanus TaxID=36987 RepID=A0A6L2PVK6_COPFO|nr:hypothetical protein Cfor_10907 [Coptotermes formosanus]
MKQYQDGVNRACSKVVAATNRHNLSLYRVFQKSLHILDMLEQFLFPHFGEDDHEGRAHFQQDGATPHYHRDVRKCLNTRFPGRWIGRPAPIPWPPRSLRWIFSCGVLSKTERTCYPYLQMSHSSELELPLQLQK